MATKKTTKKSTGVPNLKDSAHDIWLAGLGAFAMAGEEGGKLFKQLVEKGSELETTNKDRIVKLAEKAEGLKAEAKGAAKKAVAPLESGLATAMQKLGVPTREEIVTLTKRVEELTKAVAKAKTAAQAKPTPKAKPAARKAAESTEA